MLSAIFNEYLLPLAIIIALYVLWLLLSGSFALLWHWGRTKISTRTDQWKASNQTFIDKLKAFTRACLFFVSFLLLLYDLFVICEYSNKVIISFIYGILILSAFFFKRARNWLFALVRKDAGGTLGAALFLTAGCVTIDLAMRSMRGN